MKNIYLRMSLSTILVLSSTVYAAENLKKPTTYAKQQQKNPAMFPELESTMIVIEEILSDLKEDANTLVKSGDLASGNDMNERIQQIEKSLEAAKTNASDNPEAADAFLYAAVGNTLLATSLNESSGNEQEKILRDDIEVMNEIAEKAEKNPQAPIDLARSNSVLEEVIKNVESEHSNKNINPLTESTQMLLATAKQANLIQSVRNYKRVRQFNPGSAAAAKIVLADLANSQKTIGSGRAFKTFKNKSDHEVEEKQSISAMDIRREIMTAQKTTGKKFPNIVEFKGSVSLEDKMTIIMEKAEGLTLQEISHEIDDSNAFDDARIQKIFRSIGNQIGNLNFYFYENGKYLVHPDAHWGNFMYDESLDQLHMIDYAGIELNDSTYSYNNILSQCTQMLEEFKTYVPEPELFPSLPSSPEKIEMIQKTIDQAIQNLNISGRTLYAKSNTSILNFFKSMMEGLTTQIATILNSEPESENFESTPLKGFNALAMGIRGRPILDYSFASNLSVGIYKRLTKESESHNIIYENYFDIIPKLDTDEVKKIVSRSKKHLLILKSLWEGYVKSMNNNKSIKQDVEAGYDEIFNDTFLPINKRDTMKFKMILDKMDNELVKKGLEPINLSDYSHLDNQYIVS